MKVGISIKPVLPLMENLQEFLEDIFAELDDMKDVEVHTNDLNEFTIFLLNLAKKLKIRYTIHCPHFYSEYKVNFCSNKKEDIENAEYWLKKSIKYAKELKSKYIILHPDVSKNTQKREALDILEKHIKTNLRFLKNGQKILIETCLEKNILCLRLQNLNIF
jgi:endonuclease IV